MLLDVGLDALHATGLLEHGLHLLGQLQVSLDLELALRERFDPVHAAWSVSQ